MSREFVTVATILQMDAITGPSLIGWLAGWLGRLGKNEVKYQRILCWTCRNIGRVDDCPACSWEVTEVSGNG